MLSAHVSISSGMPLLTKRLNMLQRSKQEGCPEVHGNVIHDAHLNTTKERRRAKKGKNGEKGTEAALEAESTIRALFEMSGNQVTSLAN